MVTVSSQQAGSISLFDSLSGDGGLAGRVALSWSLAGGFVAGCVLLVLSTFAGGGSASGVPIAATALFALGAVAGFVHGAIVGLAGRPPGVSYGASVRGLEVAVLWAVPALLVAWVPTLWAAMVSVAVTTGRLSVLVGAAAGWFIGLGALAWATGEGLSAMVHAMRRWPEHKPGSILVFLTFATLAVAFLATRPEIWWTDLQVSGFGAVLLALGATFWIAVPVVVFVLHFLNKLRADGPM